MRHIKSLVLITLAILIVGGGFFYFFNKKKLPPAIELNVSGQPTIGYPKASVHIVVFEEPKCSNCRDFNQKIFPMIKREFIDKNKVTYTVIPVSFLPGSMPAATALLCVYYADKDYPNDEMYFKYFDYIYDHQPAESSDWATPDKLVEFAKKTSPAIETKKLKKCVEMESYRIQIEKNTAYGKELMGGRIVTPTIYINGIKVEEVSESSIHKLITEVLETKGVY